MRTPHIALAATLILASCNSDHDAGLVTPDGLYPSADTSRLYITSSAGTKIIEYHPPTSRVTRETSLGDPVKSIVQDPAGRLWAVTGQNHGQNHGRLLQLDTHTLKPLASAQIGPSPSSICWSTHTATLWITHRGGNQIWEIDPDNLRPLAILQTGREPVAAKPFDNGRRILVVNNLPAASPLDHPVAAQIDIIDASQKTTRSIPLPNGSTDARDAVISADGRYAYITHLLARHHLPVYQPDNGWTITNALSIIDLQNTSLYKTVLLDTPQKGAANPAGICLSRDGSFLLVALSGIHEIARISTRGLHEKLAASHTGQLLPPEHPPEENTALLQGIRDFIPARGQGPRSLAIIGNRLYAANHYSGNLFSMDILKEQGELIQLGAPLSSTPLGRGDMHFHDATISYQGWLSCASCHPDNARADGLAWRLPDSSPPDILPGKTPTPVLRGVRHPSSVIRQRTRQTLSAEPERQTTEEIAAWIETLKPGI